MVLFPNQSTQSSWAMLWLSFEYRISFAHLLSTSLRIGRWLLDDFICLLQWHQYLEFHQVDDSVGLYNFHTLAIADRLIALHVVESCYYQIALLEI